MAVRILSGVPGKGKTLFATYLAIKHYKSDNSLLGKVWFYFGYYREQLRVLFHNHVLVNFNIKKYLLEMPLDKYSISELYIGKKINTVYSNYPILLDKRKKIWSRKCSVFDLNNDYSLLPYAFVAIDELQFSFDSDEFADIKVKNIVSAIAKYQQAHRHFGVKDIYFISQSPDRVTKKIRNVTEEYLKINTFIKIPSIFKSFGIGFLAYCIYYRQDDYGLPTKVDKKYITFDYKKRFKIFNYKKVFSSYNTTCMAELNRYKPLLDRGCYDDYKLSIQDIKNNFFRS